MTHLVVATHLHTVTPTTNKPENDNESASHGPGVLGEEVAIDAAFRSSFSCGFNDASAAAPLVPMLRVFLMGLTGMPLFALAFPLPLLLQGLMLLNASFGAKYSSRLIV